MNTEVYVPACLRAAASHLRFALANQPLERLSKAEFVRSWCSLFYIYPGLHPDGYDHPDSGWPRVLKRFAAEAWRRAHAGGLAEEELYACDSQWAGLYDQMIVPSELADIRRRELAFLYGRDDSLWCGDDENAREFILAQAERATATPAAILESMRRAYP